MKYLIYIIVLFIIVGTGFKSYITTAYNLEFNASEIIKPDSSLLAIIDRHIYVMKKRGIKNPRNKVIYMQIIKGLSITDGVPKYIIDSMYSTNDFSVGIKEVLYPPQYLCSVRTDFVASVGIYMHAYKSVFYYKHNNWDVIIVSDLMIKMAHVSKPKKIIIKSEINVDKNNRIDRITNNYTVFSFFGNFMFPNEIIANPIRGNDKHRLDYCNEKSRVVKVTLQRTKE